MNTPYRTISTNKFVAATKPSLFKRLKCLFLGHDLKITFEDPKPAWFCCRCEKNLLPKDWFEAATLIIFSQKKDKTTMNNWEV